MSRRGCSLFEVLEYVAQDVSGPLRWLALHAEPLHDLAVSIDVLALVQVESAGQLLEIDHVGQVRLGKAHDGERPGLGGVAARPERRDLERDPGILGRLDQVPELRPEHLPAADWPPQCRLVHDGPQARAALLGEQFLPGDADADAAPYLLLGRAGPAAGPD